MQPSRSSASRGILCPLLASLAAFTGCAGAGSHLYTAEGRHLSDLAPVDYRIAVAPVAEPAGGATAAGALPLAFSLAELQQRLVGDLERMNAATEVFAVGDDAVREATLRRADLLLRPRLLYVKLGHAGSSDAFLLSGALWITTWLGALFVGDSRYDARLELEWDVVNPSGERTIDTLTARSDQVDLAFFERNEPLSLGSLQSLVLPPFLTSDSSERTSMSLSCYATECVAAQLVSYLKTRLPRDGRDMLGDFRADSPRNGAHVVGPLDLRGRIAAGGPISEVTVYVNDGEEPALELTGKDLPPIDEQRRGWGFQVPLRAQLELAPGRNVVAVQFLVGGENSLRTSRTLEVFNDVELGK